MKVAFDVLLLHPLLLGMPWLGILGKPRHFQVLLQSSSRRLCQAIHPAMCFAKKELPKSLIGYGLLLLLLLLSALRFYIEKLQSERYVKLP